MPFERAQKEMHNGAYAATPLDGWKKSDSVEIGQRVKQYNISMYEFSLSFWKCHDRRTDRALKRANENAEWFSFELIVES